MCILLIVVSSVVASSGVQLIACKDPYSLEIYTACVKMNFLRPVFRKLSSDRQTYRQVRNFIGLPRRFARGQ